jgi:hypothetical protein
LIFFSDINITLGVVRTFQLVVNLVQVSLMYTVAKSICDIQDYFFWVPYSLSHASNVCLCD